MDTGVSSDAEVEKIRHIPAQEQMDLPTSLQQNRRTRELQSKKKYINCAFVISVTRIDRQTK